MCIEYEYKGYKINLEKVCIEGNKYDILARGTITKGYDIFHIELRERKEDDDNGLSFLYISDIHNRMYTSVSYSLSDNVIDSVYAYETNRISKHIFKSTVEGIIEDLLYNRYI